MGQIQNLCGSNIFKQLLDQYGDNFVKFLLAEKSKDVIKDKFMEFSNKAQQIIEQIENHIKSLINGKTQMLVQLFQKAKAKADQKIPGGIATLQRLKGDTVSNFSGFNSLVGKINQIRDQSLNKVQQRKLQVNHDLQQTKNAMIDKIQSQRPKIPVYQQLPNQLKRQILNKTQKQFGDRILENKDVVLQTLEKNYMPKSYEKLGGLFNDINPENPLSNLLNNALNFFISNILGSNQGFGNLINNIF